MLDADLVEKLTAVRDGHADGEPVEGALKRLVAAGLVWELGEGKYELSALGHTTLASEGGERRSTRSWLRFGRG